MNNIINDDYLNSKGLTNFFNKIKTVFATKDEIKELRGEDGSTPIIKAGTATSLDANASPTVSASTSGITTTFNFGIPKGDTSDIKTPIFDDSVSTYTTLDAVNTAAETTSNAIKSKVSIFTTLSNMKKSFSAIVQGLKILATNVGAIHGITDSLTSTSSNIAASAAAINKVNSNLSELFIVQNYSATLNVPANGLVASDFKFKIPDGYVVAAVTLTCGSIYIFAEMEDLHGKFKVKNEDTATKSVTVRACLLLRKSL